eukprot:m.35573 g.35573  ORF g.35573 m.35573 type:complete len:336 (+) comp14417_c0_seq16:149-1156(+)
MSTTILAAESVVLPDSIKHKSTNGVNEQLWDSHHDKSGCIHSIYHGVGKFLLDEYSTILLVMRLLWTVETFFVTLLAIGSPIFFYYFRSNGDAIVYPLSWTVVSFAVVFPLTMSLNEAFARRERGLEELSRLKSSMLSQYLAHKYWDWTGGDLKKGRDARLRLGHTEDARKLFLQLLQLIRLQLQSPIVSRARHQFTKTGGEKQSNVLSVVRDLQRAVQSHLEMIQLLSEELKFAGMPGNEASRIRNYFASMVHSYEHLIMLKHYRTPLGLRAFARAYIAVTPIVFGPYYAAVAGLCRRGASILQDVYVRTKSFLPNMKDLCISRTTLLMRSIIN